MKKHLLFVLAAATAMAAIPSVSVCADVVDIPEPGTFFLPDDDLYDDETDETEITEDIDVGNGTEISGQLVVDNGKSSTEFILPAALSVGAAALSGALIFGLKGKKQ